MKNYPIGFTKRVICPINWDKLKEQKVNIIWVMEEK